MRIKIAILELAALLLMGSCIADAVQDKEARTAADLDSIEVDAEFVPGGAGNEIKVVIRSNRSWFAHLNDLDNPVDPSDPDASVPWATLSTDHHSNLTNTADETEITISFERNYSRTGINGVLNIYSEGDIAASVPIFQKGAVWHLSASASRDVAQCDEDKIAVNVDCNTAWTVRLDEATTALATVDVTEGFDPGTVNVVFGENFSMDQEKKAVLVFSAEDCEPVRVEIRQNRAVPYIYIMEDNDPSVLAGEKTASMFIRSNTSWTAEVAQSSLEDFSIVNASGSAGTQGPQEVKVKFTPNPAGDPSQIESATIRFTASGVQEPVDYTFTQRGVLLIDFSDIESFTPEIPVEYTGAGIRPGKTKDDIDTFVFNNGVRECSVVLTQYMRRITNTGGTWLYIIGAGIRPYIKFPGIEGLTLKKMTTVWRSFSDATQICAFAGNVLSDDHPEKTAVELTEYVNNISWSGSSQPKVIDFDLSQTGQTLEPGRGCVLRFSHANAAGNIDRTRAYLVNVQLKYQ